MFTLISGNEYIKSSLPRRFPAAMDTTCCAHAARRQSVCKRSSVTAASADRAAVPAEISEDWMGLIDPEVNSERAVGRGGRAQLRAKGAPLVSRCCGRTRTDGS